MAKLGKAVKGKSKKKKKGGKGAGDGKENALLKKVAEMEQADYQRKMAQQARAMLKVRLLPVVWHSVAASGPRLCCGTTLYAVQAALNPVHVLVAVCGADPIEQGNDHVEG